MSSWGGGVGGNQFPKLLMVSPNLLKSQIPMSSWGEEVGGNQFPTFNAESKFAKIPNSHAPWGVGWWKPISNF